MSKDFSNLEMDLGSILRNSAKRLGVPYERLFEQSKEPDWSKFSDKDLPDVFSKIFKDTLNELEECSDFKDESNDVLNIKSGDVEGGKFVNGDYYKEFDNTVDDAGGNSCRVFLKKGCKIDGSNGSISGCAQFDVAKWTELDSLHVVQYIWGEPHNLYIDRDSVFAVSVSA
ncbi:hypothetical protein N9043_00390 [bacterium]|nr:hypothetical protein [bacterium]